MCCRLWTGPSSALGFRLQGLDFNFHNPKPSHARCLLAQEGSRRQPSTLNPESRTQQYPTTSQGLAPQWSS